MSSSPLRSPLSPPFLSHLQVLILSVFFHSYFLSFFYLPPTFCLPPNLSINSFSLAFPLARLSLSFSVASSLSCTYFLSSAIFFSSLFAVINLSFPLPIFISSLIFLKGLSLSFLCCFISSLLPHIHPHSFFLHSHFFPSTPFSLFLLSVDIHPLSISPFYFVLLLLLLFHIPLALSLSQPLSVSLTFILQSTDLFSFHSSPIFHSIFCLIFDLHVFLFPLIVSLSCSFSISQCLTLIFSLLLRPLSLIFVSFFLILSLFA